MYTYLSFESDHHFGLSDHPSPLLTGITQTVTYSEEMPLKNHDVITVGVDIDKKPHVSIGESISN